jgi:Uma2 family endonuclease
MLDFGQVSTKTQIRAEDYLRMTFEHDAEFVHGEIVERGMPDEIHSAIQFLILLRFGSLIESYPLYPRPEIRMKVAPEKYRVADVAIFEGLHPKPVPDKPPLIVIEILSKDDRHSELIEKLDEYRQWGVPHIWVIDPIRKRFTVYSELGLQNMSSLSVSEYPITLTPEDLFSNL